MTLDRADIERRVPHTGTMCLLNEVMQWDATHIACTAVAPGAAHPLARDGRVPAIAAAEYAAQAAAVHGALLDGRDSPRAGMLAKLSEVELHTACVAADDGPLAVRAELLSSAAAGCLYAFMVSGKHVPIASGRLLVAFVPSAAS